MRSEELLRFVSLDTKMYVQTLLCTQVMAALITTTLNASLVTKLQKRMHFIYAIGYVMAASSKWCDPSVIL